MNQTAYGNVFRPNLKLSIWLFVTFAASVSIVFGSLNASGQVQGKWKIGTPIVNYWAGPGYPGGGPLTDAAAKQMREGGWNVVWCSENELDIVKRNGLRGLLTDPLLGPTMLNDPTKRDALTALIERVKNHPALYAYHITDEPAAGQFPQLATVVAFLRERDPKHLAYINLLPTYANNEQLGTKGNKLEAYNEHLRDYVEVVKPDLLSYDHYQFTNSGDNPDYFLNLAILREKSLKSGLPFMNIVQAANWVPGAAASPRTPRVPTPDEMSYLVYTTLAYGAQGISYYVYCYPGHEGGITKPDGTPTPLYDVLKKRNREFVAVAQELQSTRPMNTYHVGMNPPGTSKLPDKYPFSFSPPIPDMPYIAGDRVHGVLLSEFGKHGKRGDKLTHMVIVNLDYKSKLETTLNCPKSMEIFDATSRKWIRTQGKRVPLRLEEGCGVLLRVR